MRSMPRSPSYFPAVAVDDAQIEALRSRAHSAVDSRRLTITLWLTAVTPTLSPFFTRAQIIAPPA